MVVVIALRVVQSWIKASDDGGSNSPFFAGFERNIAVGSRKHTRRIGVGRRRLTRRWQRREYKLGETSRIWLNVGSACNKKTNDAMSLLSMHTTYCPTYSKYILLWKVWKFMNAFDLLIYGFLYCRQ
jgi:hypothetical protein